MDGGTVVNLGVQRFDRIREQMSFYIDKTSFIKEWWENRSDVTLITRPRRFGKTLNMSMIECFFSNRYAGRGDLFEGLSIWGDEGYRQLQGTFPVIFLSFASIKAVNCDDMKYKMTEVIADLYNENTYLLKGDVLNSNEKEYYESIKPGMEDKVVAGTVYQMAKFMHRYYGKEVIILLDEYDTPMQEAWLGGYWEEAVNFFRCFFDKTFKSNPYLHRGIITGITRVSKESIFSDLNNLDVVTTTSDAYATSFGFTQDEVFMALEDMGLGGEKESVKYWYDGFTFGSHTDIYNPWSITSYLKQGGKYKAYWANTSSNGLVNSLIQTGKAEIKETMETLLKGGSFTAMIDEQIVFNQLGSSENAVWSLLLATGYLKVLEVETVGERKDMVFTLTLTNLEVSIMFENMVNNWFKDNSRIPYNDFIKAMLTDDVDSMNEFMNDIALESFSSFDTAKGASSKDASERFYHGFVLGMIVDLSDRYVIKSNRESGFGRYDILMKPIDQENGYAYIIEFKVHKPRKEKDLEETLANALKQIEERRYEAELIGEGFLPKRIRKYGFAFRGKECLIG
ncbi:MAG: ATP-binding protein [Lachnospiraceae bacterium]|nr:ATP-binding protein [Lachnospiraceae bacterium]